MANPFETSVDDSYNPFAMGSNYQDPAPQQQQAPPPTTNTSYTDSQPSQAPASSASNQQGGYKDQVMGIKLTDEELAAREEALRKREERIAAREREIEEARANGTLGQLNPHPRNFPILLKFYKYYPEDDLEEEFRPVMSRLFWLSYGSAIVLCINALLSLFYLTKGPADKIDSPATSIVFAWFFLIILYPISLESVVMPFYNALKEFKGMKFVGYLIMSALYFFFYVYIAVGLGAYGSFGWIIAINGVTAAEGKWVGIIAIIFSIIATLFVVAWGWVWWQSLILFRKTDFKNRAVKEAAGYAVNYANDHKEEIAKAAAENPDAVVGAATYASSMN